MMTNKLFVTFLMGTIALGTAIVAVNGSSAREPERFRTPGPTIIVACAYLNPADVASDFGTRVIGVESAGLRSPPITKEMTCAQAFDSLIEAGFTLVHTGPTTSADFDGDGRVDAADFIVWR